MVSIIIPAFNAEKTIGQCLESIFAQTFRDSQIIIVDDASTDGTWDTLSAIRNHELGIRNYEFDPDSLFLIHNSVNRGAQAARNRGWREAQKHPPPSSSPTRGEEIVENSPPLVGGVRGGGQYVFFCDADIVLRPDCLEKMVRALEEHPEASYAYSSFKFGWKKFKLWPFDAVRLRRMPYIHTTSLIRRSAIQEALPPDARRQGLPISSGPFDESIKRLQDWDLWLTMREQGHTGIWVPEVLFRVINTKGTMSQWLPSFAYKIPKWLGIQPKAAARYNEAVERIKEKHGLR